MFLFSVFTYSGKQGDTILHSFKKEVQFLSFDEVSFTHVFLRGKKPRKLCAVLQKPISQLNSTICTAKVLK